MQQAQRGEGTARGRTPPSFVPSVKSFAPSQTASGKEYASLQHYAAAKQAVAAIGCSLHTRSKNVAEERGQSEQSEGHDRPRTPARKYLRVIGKTSEGPPVTFAFEAAKFPFRSSEHLHSQNVSFLIPEGRFSPSLTLQNSTGGGGLFTETMGDIRGASADNDCRANQL